MPSAVADIEVIRPFADDALRASCMVCAISHDYDRAQLILEHGTPVEPRRWALVAHRRWRQQMIDWNIACEVQQDAPAALEEANELLRRARWQLSKRGWSFHYTVSPHGFIHAHLEPEDGDGSIVLPPTLLDTKLS